MEQNEKPSQVSLSVWQMLFTFAGTVIVAYLGYLGVRTQIETPIHATQTAEARPTPIPPTATVTPRITPTIEIVVKEVTKTPTLIPTLPIVSPTTSEIIITLPTPQELTRSKNIWDLVNYTNPTAPVTRTYNVIVSVNSKYKWGAVWCGKNAQTLQSILRPLTMTLMVNGQVLDESTILEFDEVVSGWSCHRWTTIISGWQHNTTTKLELSYFLSETIYDGTSYTQQGEYHLIIYVTVQ
jgi:hypothetical protein